MTIGTGRPNATLSLLAGMPAFTVQGAFPTSGGLDDIQFYVDPRSNPQRLTERAAKPTKPKEKPAGNVSQVPSANLGSLALACEAEMPTVAQRSAPASTATGAASARDSDSTDQHRDHDHTPLLPGPLVSNDATGGAPNGESAPHCSHGGHTVPPQCSLQQMHSRDLYKVNVEVVPRGFDEARTTPPTDLSSRPQYQTRVAIDPCVDAANTEDPHASRPSLSRLASEQARPQDRSFASHDSIDISDISSGSDDEPRIPCMRRLHCRNEEALITQHRSVSTHSGLSSHSLPPHTGERRTIKPQRRRRQDPQQPSRCPSSRESSLSVATSVPSSVPRKPQAHRPSSERRPIQCFLSSQRVSSGIQFTLELPPLDVGPCAPIAIQPAARSRKRMKYSAADNKRLLKLRRQTNPKLTWKQIQTHFPGRTQGSIQVHYSTQLMEKYNRKRK
ncbi:hypothetical protein Q7P37_003069 [Cladosporium fusiforme]